MTEDKLQEMVSLRGNVTGIDTTLFISPRDRSVKVANDPRRGTASIALDGEVVAGKIEPSLLYQVRVFIERNRQVLTDYANYKIATDEP